MLYLMLFSFIYNVIKKVNLLIQVYSVLALFIKFHGFILFLILQQTILLS